MSEVNAAIGGVLRDSDAPLSGREIELILESKGASRQVLDFMYDALEDMLARGVIQKGERTNRNTGDKEEVYMSAKRSASGDSISPGYRKLDVVYGGERVAKTVNRVAEVIVKLLAQRAGIGLKKKPLRDAILAEIPQASGNQINYAIKQLVDAGLIVREGATCAITYHNALYALTHEKSEDEGTPSASRSGTRPPDPAADASPSGEGSRKSPATRPAAASPSSPPDDDAVGRLLAEMVENAQDALDEYIVEMCEGPTLTVLKRARNDARQALADYQESRHAQA